MFSSVCVICTGNICRSPMAEAMLRAATLPGIQRVYSAGTHALVGHPADTYAVTLLQSLDIDLSQHRAQQATAQLLSAADLILGLDHHHLDWLGRHHPHLRSRAFKVMHWSGGEDVPDPYQRGAKAFITAQKLIEQGLAGWQQRLG